ncbi:MAG: ATP-binding protein [Desulfocapsaceae bacterium]|nr:ATP-binding protein [Desulfocapsaceae bacterium]
MLIEFSIRNYRSFWETQTLSMAAGPTKELQEENSFTPPTEGLPKLLRSAVVYGPNGGGKSNLIAALNFMKQLVLSSSKESQEGENIERKPFLLHSHGPSQSSEFEAFFIQDGIRYQYGFETTEKRVTHEWLLAYPGNRAQRWFERSYNPEKQEENWYFGAKLTGPKKTWQDSTRSNALFLSTAVQLNSEQLKPVFSWFKNLVIIRHGEIIDRDFTVKSCEDKDKCGDILKFLKGADILVDGIEIKERKFETFKFPSDLPEELKNVIQKDLQGQSFKEVFFKHQLSDTGDSVSFPLQEESDGTQKLFAYAAPWLDVLNNGRVLVVDELDNSFHPHLVRFLLNLIHNSKSNKKNGQLIFSTHDTSILDSKILRRDQIWFTEKDNNHATQLYPLTNFHPRKDEALEKGYLQGRFGALPYIGEVKF